MKRAIIAALIGLATITSAHAETDILVFGHSQHFKNSWNSPYNQWNFGAGVEYAPDGLRSDWGALSGQWLAGGFVVRDSIYRIGGAAYAGYRLEYHFSRDWHAEVTLRAGVIKDAYYTGFAALPAIGIGYKRLTVEATFIPHIQCGNRFSDPVAVIWARYTF